MPDHLVVVGGGPAAINAVETIRQFDADSKVTLVCDEPAHSRMALPYLLSGQIPVGQTHTGDADYFRRLNVNTLIGQRATKLEEDKRRLHLERGDVLEFDRLLIATGSKPTSLPIPGADLPGVQHLWTLAQTEAVLRAAEGHERPRIVMIGAGFIGLIVLNAMHKRGWQLTVVEQQAQILPRMLDAHAAAFAKSWLSQKQVTVHADSSVQAIELDDDGTKHVHLADGAKISADIVIVATGVRPNLALVKGSSIPTDHGILVDRQLQTRVSGIYAAGDVAQGPVLFGTQKEVHAIQPTAVDHGRVAGANMAGQSINYSGSLSMNVLDVCGLQCASFGQWQDTEAETFTISNPKELIYRALRWTDDRVTGAIFVGRASDMGMLTDVGMVKGLIQTGVCLGKWKDYLQENPFDIRRAFIAKNVPRLLMDATLLGKPAAARQYRFGDESARHQPGPAHQTYVDTKS